MLVKRLSTVDRAQFSTRAAPAAVSEPNPPDGVELSRVYEAMQATDRLEPAWQVHLSGSFIGPDQRCANTTPILDAEGSLYLGSATQFVKVSDQGRVLWRVEQPPKHSILSSLAFGADRDKVALVHNYFDPPEPGQFRGRSGSALKVVSMDSGEEICQMKDINFETLRKGPDGSLWFSKSTGEIYQVDPKGELSLAKGGVELSEFQGMLSDAKDYVFALQPTGSGVFFTSNRGLGRIGEQGVQRIEVEGATPFNNGLVPTQDGGVYCVSRVESGSRLTRLNAAGEIEWAHDVSTAPGLIHTLTADDGFAFAELQEDTGRVVLTKYDARGNREWSAEHPDLRSQGAGTMGSRVWQDWPDIQMAPAGEGGFVVLSRDLGLAAGLAEGRVSWSHQSPIEEHGRGLDVRPRPNYSVSPDQKNLWVTLNGDLTRVDLVDGSVDFDYDPASRRFSYQGETRRLNGEPFRFLGNVLQSKDGRLYSLDNQSNYAAVELPLSLEEALERNQEQADTEVEIEMGVDYVDVGGVLLPYEA